MARQYVIKHVSIPQASSTVTNYLGYDVTSHQPVISPARRKWFVEGDEEFKLGLGHVGKLQVTEWLSLPGGEKVQFTTDSGKAANWRADVSSKEPVYISPTSSRMEAPYLGASSDGVVKLKSAGFVGIYQDAWVFEAE